MLLDVHVLEAELLHTAQAPAMSGGNLHTADASQGSVLSPAVMPSGAVAFPKPPSGSQQCCDLQLGDIAGAQLWTSRLDLGLEPGHDASRVLQLLTKGSLSPSISAVGRSLLSCLVWDSFRASYSWRPWGVGLPRAGCGAELLKFRLSDFWDGGIKVWTAACCWLTWNCLYRRYFVGKKPRQACSSQDRFVRKDLMKLVQFNWFVSRYITY